MVNAPISNQTKEASCLNSGSPTRSIFTNIVIAKINVIDIAPIETQSPSRGRRFPKNIWITNAKRGRNKINNE